MSVYTTNVSGMIIALNEVMTHAIRDGSIQQFPAVMLWGAPGVGKSQGIKQLADKLSETTGKRVFVTDVRLLLFNPVDLRGVPLANAERTMAVWLKPKIFCMDEGVDVVNILFLDEISAAPPSVQAAAYQIALDKTVGEHKLPDNCFVLCAGNRTTDKSVAYKMPRALANRLCHFEIDVDFESFRAWATAKGVDARIIGFLSNSRTYLLQDSEKNDEVAYATPRSWETVDKFIKLSDGDITNAFPFIAGALGLDIATEFAAWCKTQFVLPSIKDIFDGVDKRVPRETNALYALISSMLDYAKKHLAYPQKIENSLRYAVGFPPDYTYTLLRDYMAASPELKAIVMDSATVRQWIVAHKRYLNG